MLTDNERRLIDRLPLPSRQKFVKIATEADTLAAANRDFSERRQDLRRSIETEQASLDRLTSQPPYPDVNDATVAMALASIASKKNELLDMEAGLHERSERRRPLADIIRRTLDLLASVPRNKNLQSVPPKPAVLRRGESHSEAVDRLRGRLQTLRAERDEIEGAPLPAAMVKERAAADLDRLAESGRPYVYAMVDHGEISIKWPTVGDRVIGEGAVGYVERPDMLALLAHFLKAELRAAIFKAIDDANDYKDAMTPADKKAGIARIDAEIEEVEHGECAHLEAAQNAGISIAPRADVDIHGFLGLSKILAAGPEVDQTPKMTGYPARNRAEAPQHPSSLPEPALRDEIWR